jgi:hypothetical protein
MGDELRCEVCGVHDENTHVYAVCVDGVPLRLALVLCNNHGGNFLIRMGAVMASLREPIENVIVGWKRRTAN